MKQKLIYQLDELPELVSGLAEQLQDKKIIVLVGELGAGKTTLVKALLKEWGVSDDITSPTFAYVNYYKNRDGRGFFHFDLYRIGGLEEFLSQGFDEYLQQSNMVCIIEWPQVIEPLLKSGYTCLSLKHVASDSRSITILTDKMGEFGG